MENEMYEQEIDLKDLMFAVLHSWRAIIITALACAVLLGGYGLAKSALSREEGGAAEAEQAYTEDLALYEDTQLLYEYDIELLKEKIEAQEAYYTQSYLMQINPYDMAKASADIFIKADSEAAEGTAVYVPVSDPADSILKAYEVVVQNADGIEAVGTESLDAQYIRELIQTGLDYEGNVLTVTVYGKNTSDAAELLEKLLENIQAEKAGLQAELGTHELYVMDTAAAITIDSNLVSKQKSVSDSITSLQDTLSAKETALEELEQPAEPAAASASAGLKSGVKYGVIGGAAGVFLAGFCLCVVFVIKDGLNSEKDLKNRFGLNILGVFSQPVKKRAFSGIDAWLDRLEGKTHKNSGAVYDLAAANTKNYMEKDAEILLIGSVSGDKLEQAAKELRSRIDGVQILVGVDIANSVESLKLLKETDQVILVEERGLSKCADIQEQLELVRSLHKPVIGGIVL